MKESGHPYYQFYSNDLIDYEKRCKEQDINGHQLIFGCENIENDRDMKEIENNSDYNSNDEELIDEVDVEENRETNYLNNDPVKKKSI